LVVAFVVSGVLLMGTSIPTNAQENQNKQQSKEQRKAAQQQCDQQQQVGPETKLPIGVRDRS